MKTGNHCMRKKHYRVITLIIFKQAVKTDCSSNIWIRYNFVVKLSEVPTGFNRRKQTTSICNMLTFPFLHWGASFCSVERGHLDNDYGSSIFLTDWQVKSTAHRPTIHQQTQMGSWCTNVRLLGVYTIMPQTHLHTFLVAQRFLPNSNHTIGTPRLSPAEFPKAL